MQGKITLKNYMEDMVDECLRGLLRKKTDETGLLSNPRILMEIKMEALNRLPTFYVTGKAGEVYGEYRMKEQQYNTDITIAVSASIEAVLERYTRRAGE